MQCFGTWDLPDEVIHVLTLIKFLLQNTNYVLGSQTLNVQVEELGYSEWGGVEKQVNNNPL